MENVVVDHLSRLTIAHNTHDLPIFDEFPEESLLAVDSAPWLAHIANFLVIGELPTEWKAQDKKFFHEKKSIPTTERSLICSNIMMIK